jgi:hypothetical protein
LSGETVYRYNFNNGILKVYAAFDSSQLDINQENINAPDKIRVAVNNNNFYFNTSYNGRFGSGWQLVSGLSYGYSKNQIGLDLDNVNNDERTFRS